MKTQKALVCGLIAIILALAFATLSLTGCGDPEGGPTGGGPTGGGLKTLSGTVSITPNTDVEINMELTATYSGSEAVSFQWKKDGVNVGTASTTKPNKYTPTEAGSYTVTVSATGYNSKTSAVVDVNDPDLPTLSGDITISPNGSVVNTELTAAYSGSEAVSFQWKKDGVNVGTASTTNPNKYTPTEPGSYAVTVSASGYNRKTSATVTVIGATLDSLSGTITITVNGSEVTTATTGTELTATYSGTETVAYQWKKDGTAISSATSNEYTPQEAGSYTVTVSASGSSKTSAAVTVTDLDLSLINSIYLSQPYNRTYIISEPLDLSGGKIKAYDKDYNDIGDFDITLDMISGYDPMTQGEQTITVTFGDKTATFIVEVVGITEIYSITEPNKKLYALNEPLSLNGLKMYVLCTNGYQKNFTFASDASIALVTTSGFDSSTLGEKTVTITFLNQTATFKVTVVEDNSGIEEKPLPLTENVWVDGKRAGETWYEFDVTSGTTYYIWWNNRYEGDGTRTAYSSGSACYIDQSMSASPGSLLFYYELRAWNTPQSFTASKDSTVKLRINQDSTPDSYSVVYNTTGIKPGTEALSVTFVSLTAYNSSTTGQGHDRLRLNFDTEIPGLTIYDITLDSGTTGAIRGTFSSGGVLDIRNNVADGYVTVTVAKAGYNITPSSREVFVEKVPIKRISLNQSDTYTFPVQEPGYDPAEIALTVIINNTGNQPTGDLTAALASVVADNTYNDFELLPPSISSIEPGSTGSFIVRPKTGLGNGTRRATVNVSGTGLTGQTFNVEFRVSTTPVYDFTISASGAHTFPEALERYGYNSQSVNKLTVTVTNTGNSMLSVDLQKSGANPDSFSLPSSLTNLRPGSNNAQTFDVQPANDLSPGTHTATITAIAQGVSHSFDVSFTVIARPVISITTQPAPSTSLMTDNISGSLSVVATVTESAALSYQWYINTTNSNRGGTVIADATSASYPIPTTLGQGIYYFYCVVNAANSKASAGPYATNTATVTVITASYGITLSQTGTHTFTAATYNYGAAPAALSVNVNNTGNTATGALTVALSGTYASDFTLSTTTIASIAGNGTATGAFTVTPKTGLNAGTYTATVTVTGGSNITASFIVSFTVNKAAGGTVSAPSTTPAALSDTSITLTAVTAPTTGQVVEYAVNTTTTTPTTDWQEGTVFTGLNASTAYYFFARAKENTNYNAGTVARTASAITTQAPKPVITITTQPVSTTVSAGYISGSLSVAASVTQSASLSYQWYSNQTNSNTGGTAVASGGTGASFTIPTTLTVGTYYYFCEVSATNATSVRSNVATVTVNNAPVLPYNYVITGTAPSSFTAVRGGQLTVGTGAIQTVIDAIHSNAGETNTNTTIQFGSGGNDELDIGTGSIAFNQRWNPIGNGALYLTGRITSANNSTSSGTIAISGNANINSTADIANTGASGTAISGGSNSTFTISGGTVSATTGNAVYVSQQSSGTITISDNATITSANTSTTSGTIHFSGYSLTISGGTVRNTSTTGRAIYQGTNGSVSISGGRVEAQTGNAINSNATGSLSISGASTVVTSGGTTISYTVSGTGSGRLNMTGGRVETTGSSAIVLYGPATISGGTVSATTGRAVYQNSSSAITISGGRIEATTGIGVSIGDSTGKVTISGSATITSANTTATSGTIDYAGTNTTERLAITGGTVENTASGNAVYNGGSGAAAISGGTVSATTGVTVNNAGVGTVAISGSAIITGANISATSGTIVLANSGTATAARLTIGGGTVRNTSATGNAVYNNSTGALTISSGTVELNNTSASGNTVHNNSTGAVTISGGTVSARTGNTVHNASTGAVTISGGTVSATTGRAVNNAGAGDITVSGSATNITSANATATQGTIALANGSLTISSGTVQNTATSGNAVYNSGAGAININGGTITAATTGSRFAIENSNANSMITLGGDPTINGYIRPSAAGKLTVLRTGANEFLPTPTTKRFALDYAALTSGNIAVVDGGNAKGANTTQASYFTLRVNGSAATLTTSGNNLVRN